MVKDYIEWMEIVIKVSLMLVGIGLGGSVAVFCLMYAFKLANLAIGAPCLS